MAGEVVAGQLVDTSFYDFETDSEPEDELQQHNSDLSDAEERRPNKADDEDEDNENDFNQDDDEAGLNSEQEDDKGTRKRRQAKKPPAKEDLRSSALKYLAQNYQAFNYCTTLEDLAAALAVPVKALFTVEFLYSDLFKKKTTERKYLRNRDNKKNKRPLEDASESEDDNDDVIMEDSTKGPRELVFCEEPGCPYPAIMRARPRSPRCAVHGGNFYPEGDNKFFANGHLLLGPQFMNNTYVIRHALCTCGLAKCKGIGFSESSVQLGSRADLSKVEPLFHKIQRALGLSQRAVLSWKKNTRLRLAPWHFHPKYRRRDPVTGEWKMACQVGVRAAGGRVSYTDDDGTVWEYMPPPTYSLDKFIEEECTFPDVLPPGYAFRALDGTYWPKWVLEYRKYESDPAFYALFERILRMPGAIVTLNNPDEEPIDDIFEIEVLHDMLRRQRRLEHESIMGFVEELRPVQLKLQQLQITVDDQDKKIAKYDKIIQEKDEKIGSMQNEIVEAEMELVDKQLPFMENELKEIKYRYEQLEIANKRQRRDLLAKDKLLRANAIHIASLEKLVRSAEIRLGTTLTPSKSINGNAGTRAAATTTTTTSQTRADNQLKDEATAVVATVKAGMSQPENLDNEDDMELIHDDDLGGEDVEYDESSTDAKNNEDSGESDDDDEEEDSTGVDEALEKAAMDIVQETEVRATTVDRLTAAVVAASGSIAKTIDEANAIMARSQLSDEEEDDDSAMMDEIIM